MVIDGVTPILPGWVNAATAAGRTATYQIRLRGGRGYTWSFSNGRLRVAGDLPRPDVTILADPVSFLLVTYRRRSQWSQIARGRMVAWGRRPWLAFSLVGMFHEP
jgi:hypothetical protein